MQRINIELRNPQYERGKYLNFLCPCREISPFPSFEDCLVVQTSVFYVE